MNRLSQCISRANTEFRYVAYRRKIGSPISMWGACRRWVQRFAFEWRNLAPPADDLGLYGKGEPKPLSVLRASYEKLMGRR